MYRMPIVIHKKYFIRHGIKCRYLYISSYLYTRTSMYSCICLWFRCNIGATIYCHLLMYRILRCIVDIITHHDDLTISERKWRWHGRAQRKRADVDPRWVALACTIISVLAYFGCCFVISPLALLDRMSTGNTSLKFLLYWLHISNSASIWSLQNATRRHPLVPVGVGIRVTCRIRSPEADWSTAQT